MVGTSRGKYVFACLVFYAAWIDSLLPKFRDNLSVPSKTIDLLCEKYQKNEDLLYVEAEA